MPGSARAANADGGGDGGDVAGTAAFSDAWFGSSTMLVRSEDMMDFPGDCFDRDASFTSDCKDPGVEHTAFGAECSTTAGSGASSPDQVSLAREGTASRSSLLLDDKPLPSQEEISEYFARHKLREFLTDMANDLAAHAPPDPYDYLLKTLPHFIAKHHAMRDGNAELDDSSPPKQPCSSQVPAEQREKVVRHVVAALQSEGMTRASTAKVFEEFASLEESECGGRRKEVTQAGFLKLLEHLMESWGLQQEDAKLMLVGLKRWRFRTNAARGTRGHPLWPLSKDDFIVAYPSLLRSVRDHYLPIGRGVHRSLFVQQASGSVQDRYELGPKLGRGAYGEVRLVTMRETKVKRVCKQVDKSLQKVPDEELINEVELLRSLDHPHIIRVFEFFSDDESFQMIMEPVFGGTLSDLVKGVHKCTDIPLDQIGLTESWVATLLSQLLSALSFAHDVAGLIHKDLKGDNVLLVGKPNLTPQERLREPVHAMLADFGIAEVFASGGAAAEGEGLVFRERCSKVGGTPAYMSPEMFKGSFTEKSDMWSLGVVMFETLSGQWPYRARNIFALGALVTDPRNHPPWEKLTDRGWSQAACSLCQNLLSKDETARPSASEALRDFWVQAKAVASSAPGHDPEHADEAERFTLHQPHMQSHLMKVARACVTSQLNLSQLHQMNARFKYYDVSGDGRLSYAEMRQVLRDLGVAPSELELVVESLDTNHNGVIEYSEFVAGCIDLSSEVIREQLRVAFTVFDLDGSGSLSLEELRHVLTLGPASKGGVRRGEDLLLSEGVRSILPDGKTVEDLMSEMDLDKEGSVEFHEFEQYLLSEHERVGRGAATQEKRAVVRHHGRKFISRIAGRVSGSTSTKPRRPAAEGGTRRRSHCRGR